MRRWLMRIILCLILITGGAITTVAVAWGFVASFGVDPYASSDAAWRIRTSKAESWSVWRWEETGTTVILSARLKQINEPPFEDESPESLLTSWAPMHVPVDGFDDPTCQNERRSADARGWPCRALWFDGGINLGTGTAYLKRVPVRGGIRLSDDDWLDGHAYQRALPLYPIWPGFVFDTLFYAAIWGGVFFGFTSAKRFIRAKRGRCPRCGYDLRGQRMKDHGQAAHATGCPECGWGREGTGARSDGAAKSATVISS